MVLLILSKTRDLFRHQICDIRSTTFKHLCFYSLSIKYAKNNYVMAGYEQHNRLMKLANSRFLISSLQSMHQSNFSNVVFVEK